MKSAVVTGGSDGVGKALVLLLADQGYQVITIGRSPEEVAATLMQVINAPANVYIPEISIYPQIQML